MDSYVCVNCGYVFDPVKGDEEGGVASGTSFAALPDDWQCPICYVGKEEFDLL